MVLTRAIRLFWAVALVSPLSVSDANAQQTPGQEVCAGPLSGADVFSVGEIRTSILAEPDFQALNGGEWVLMDGRPLLVRTGLSAHLSEEGEYGLAIPDARGRFLRMANNDVCAEHRLGADSGDAYNQCIADRDPDADRGLGTYQGDSVGRHEHNYDDLFYSEISGFKPGSASGVPVPGGVGSGDTDWDGNVGYGIERTTHVGGSDETRPKNLAVNYYIKICNCRTTNCR